MTRVITASPSEDPGTWIWQAIQAAFAQGTPVEGMIASGVLFVLVVAWTAIGFVFTVFLDIIFGILFLVNAGRFLVQWFRER